MGWNVYDYPTPDEEKTKKIEAKIYMSFSIEEEVPDDWDYEQIKDDIKENIDDFTWFDQEIKEIEI